jgi:hypothetical protein
MRTFKLSILEQELVHVSSLQADTLKHKKRRLDAGIDQQYLYSFTSGFYLNALRLRTEKLKAELLIINTLSPSDN